MVMGIVMFTEDEATAAILWWQFSKKKLNVCSRKFKCIAATFRSSVD